MPEQAPRLRLGKISRCAIAWIKPRSFWRWMPIFFLVVRSTFATRANSAIVAEFVGDQTGPR